MNMEGEEKKSGWKIWVYLTPVYIILAILLLIWIKKINSSNIPLSREEYSAFNSDEGKIKKRKLKGYNPGLADVGYSVRYRKEGAQGGAMPGDGPSREAQEQARKEAVAREKAAARKTAANGGGYNAATAGQAALDSNDTRNKEQMAAGQKVGYLSYAVEKVMGNPKAVKGLLSNKYIVNGFMSRGTVKAATGSAEGLANYLKGPGPSNFMNNSMVKAALANPAVVSAVASSGMVSALLNTPAAQQLMSNPEMLGDLVNNNPQLMTIAMQNPQTLTMLMSNPEVSGLLGKFDTSKINTN